MVVMKRNGRNAVSADALVCIYELYLLICHCSMYLKLFNFKRQLETENVAQQLQIHSGNVLYQSCMCYVSMGWRQQ